MEGKGQDGAATPPMEQQIGDVQQHELLATALREDNTPATATSIHTKECRLPARELSSSSTAESGGCCRVSQGVHMFVTKQKVPQLTIHCMVHCGSAFEPRASGLPYYCASICVRSRCNWCASCVDSTPKKNGHGSKKEKNS